MTHASQTQGPVDSPRDDVSPPVIWAQLVLGRPDSGDAIPVHRPVDDPAGEEAGSSTKPPAPSPLAPSP
jgi:hypothetical protein